VFADLVAEQDNAARMTDAPAATHDEPAHDEPAQDEPAQTAPAPATDPMDAWDAAFAAAGQRRTGHWTSEPTPVTPPAPTRARLLTAGRRRHDALGQLLRDLANVIPGSGQPLPTRLTIIATLPALEGRLGALPAQLATSGQPATLTREQLQRLACSSDLDAVLLDALGNPVGASHPRRNLTRRERRALRAQWGATCAIAGCPTPSPSRTTSSPTGSPGAPACATSSRPASTATTTCTTATAPLRLRDGRLINEYGWVTAAAPPEHPSERHRRHTKQATSIRRPAAWPLGM
jgi:hypothetical protein